jgi:signal transduction histidine kinase
LADTRGIDLNITRENSDRQLPLCVIGDPDRIAQIIDNLLNNAIRHSAPNSAISIRLKNEENMVRCSIIDQGPGISPEHLPFIFDRFYRVEASRDRSSGGSGLGLAIVRSLVIAMGGTISAESQAGKGTAIHFSLPARENCHSTA